MFLDGTIGLAISLDIVRIVAMIFNDLVRAMDLIGEFADSVVFGRALDLKMNLDDIPIFKIMLKSLILHKKNYKPIKDGVDLSYKK